MRRRDYEHLCSASAASDVAAADGKTPLPELINPYWRSIRWIMQRVLPRTDRDAHLKLLDARQELGPLIVLEAASTIAAVYWNHSVAAFNRWGIFLQVILTVFCFAKSALPWQLSFLLATDLIALSLRAAYTYHDVRLNPQPRARYYTDSIIDAIVASIFVMASQVLATWASPSLSLPAAALYRGALVCLPLMATLRIVLRPKPDGPNTMFETSNMTGEQIHSRVWRLDILWLVTFFGLVAQNVSDKPGYLPDFFRGLSIAMFAVWGALQTQALVGRHMIQTIFTDPRKLKLELMYRRLPQGLRKGEPFYWSYIFLEATIRFVMVMSLAEAVWPWFSGDTTHASVIRTMGSVVAFATALLSWEYVKETNRAAADAIQLEIKKLAANSANYAN